MAAGPGIGQTAAQDTRKSWVTGNFLTAAFVACWWRSTNFSEKKSSKLLERYAVTDDDCLHSIVTSNESCSHRLDPETKRKIMEWHHRTLSKMRKPKTMPSTHKTTANTDHLVYCNCLQVWSRMHPWWIMIKTACRRTNRISLRRLACWQFLSAEGAEGVWKRHGFSAKPWSQLWRGSLMRRKTHQ